MRGCFLRRKIMATKKNLLAKKIYESYLEKGYYLEGRNKVSTPIINPSSEIKITVQDILNAKIGRAHV